MPNWLRIAATSPSAELSRLLAEGLLACGGSAIEEQGDTLVTYILSVDDPDAALDRIRDVLQAVLGTDAIELRDRKSVV